MWSRHFQINHLWSTQKVPHLTWHDVTWCQGLVLIHLGMKTWFCELRTSDWPHGSPALSQKCQSQLSGNISSVDPPQNPDYPQLLTACGKCWNLYYERNSFISVKIWNSSDWQERWVFMHSGRHLWFKVFIKGQNYWYLIMIVSPPAGIVFIMIPNVVGITFLNTSRGLFFLLISL